MCGRYTLWRVNINFYGVDAVPAVGFEEFDERPLFNSRRGSPSPSCGWTRRDGGR